MRSLLVTVVFAFCVCLHLDAGILGNALFSFPAQTEYVEDDNLAALRSLPYYTTLRNEFSGDALADLQTVLRQLGIPETEVEEIVTGANAKSTYGLATGTFSSKSPALKSRLKRYEAKLLDSEMYCVGHATCVLFLEDSTIAFGTPDSLKRILLARQGVLTRLSGIAEAVRLLENGDKTAPVRGILFGAHLQSTLADTLKQWFGKSIQAIQLPATVTGVGYSVKFGTAVHLQATLICTSNRAASLLAQTLNALASLRLLAAPDVNTDGFALEGAKATAAANRIQLEAEAKARFR